MEIGAGTGFSLPYYADVPLIACDPNIWMLKRARRRARKLGQRVSFVVAAGESLPFGDRTFDTVVSQLVFCTVDEPVTVASEIGRVLEEDGRFRFVEHGLATRPLYRRVQRAIAPAWRRLFGGCRLDRDVVTPMLHAGLTATKLRRCSGGSIVRGTFRSSIADTAKIKSTTVV